MKHLFFICTMLMLTIQASSQTSTYNSYIDEKNGSVVLQGAITFDDLKNENAKLKQDHVDLINDFTNLKNKNIANRNNKLDLKHDHFFPTILGCLNVKSKKSKSLEKLDLCD